MSVAYYVTISVMFSAWIFAEIMYFTFGAHMFQLNSYGTAEHMRWMKKNPQAVFVNYVSAILAVLFIALTFLFSENEIALYISIGIFALAFIAFGFKFRPRKEEKTPLKYTMRVKRLMATYMIFIAIIAEGSAHLAYKLNQKWALAVLFIAMACSPLLIILANFVNQPIEKAVKKYYLKDAQKILSECPDLTVIGITGSYGKTSMKHFLSTIMKEKYNVLIPPKNYNTPMGICMTVRSDLRGYHDFFICEMGARATGEIKELCDLVHPKHGIITSIGPQHLETFGSLDNIIKTKFELADSVKEGTCFVNIDNEYIRNNKPTNAVTYGLAEDADYHGKVISVSRNGTEFEITYPDKTVHKFTTILIGSHNVENLCGAVAMAKFLGCDDDDIENGIAKLAPVEHRLQLRKQGTTTIIDDAYNSNPSGCRAALETLSCFEETKILVTPGMVELGDEQYNLNKEFGQNAAKVCDYVILVGSKQTKPILDGLLDSGYNEDNVYVAVNFNDAMQHATMFSKGEAAAILLENDLPDNYLN